MKKILKCISLMLVLFMLMGLNVFASEPLTIDNVFPNPNGSLAYAKNIAVNQGKIEIHFSKELNPESLKGVTFVDDEGEAPVGNIALSSSENVLTVKFGELKEKMGYTLTVSTELSSADGSFLEEDAVYEFETLKKEIAGLDPVGDASIAEYSRTFSKSSGTVYEYVGSNGMIFNINNMTQDLADEIVFEKMETDGGMPYLRFRNKSAQSKNRFLRIGTVMTNQGTTENGGKPSSASAVLNDFKAVTLINYRLSETPSDQNFQQGEMNKAGTPLNDGGAIITGPKVYNVNAAFSKVDDFYQTQMIANRKVKDNTTMDADMWFDIIDVSETATLGKMISGSTKTNSNAVSGVVWINLYAGGPYMGTIEADIAYAKSGYYSIPDTLRSPKYNYSEDSLTFDFNTELSDDTLSKITLKDADTNIYVDATPSFDATTRKLTLALNGKLDYGKDYILNINGVKSKDGVITDQKSADKRFSNNLLANDFINGDNTVTVPTATKGEFAEITVDFVSAVDISDCDITVSDKNGNVLYSETSLDGNKLIVKYLNDTDYVNNKVLKISKGLKVVDSGNQSTSADYVYEFKTAPVLTVSSVSGTVSTENKLNSSVSLENHFFTEGKAVTVIHLVYDNNGRLTNSFVKTETIPLGTPTPVTLENAVVNENAEKLSVFVFDSSMKNLFTTDTILTQLQ